MDTSSDSGSDKYALLDQIAEEFAERRRGGEHPSLREYVEKYPHLADDLRDILPAMAEIEQVKKDADDITPGVPVSAPLLKNVGDYRILREIGRGGMGIVYEAEQLSLGRRVALKVLTGQARLDPRHLARFEREAKAAARLHHTNIVPVYGVGSDDGLHYYVMQFIAGMGLDAVLAEMRRLHRKGTANSTGSLSVEEVARTLSGDPSPSPAVALPGQSSAPSNRSDSGRAYWQSVARVGVQVAEALHYAHQHGILHRDVKPSNLLLDGQGVVWVTDFGLAKADDSADLTHTGDVVGTLRYLAPERFNGQSDARSDLYGLGLTLYELLALRPAFDAPDRNQLIRQVTDAEPPRLRKLVPGLPRDLETIVHKATARDPKDRYGSGQEMAADLRRFVEDRPILARRISTAERLGRWCRRNPVVAGLTGGVAAALVAAAVVSIVLAFNIKAQKDAAVQAKQDAEDAAERQAGLLGQQYTANGVRLLDAGDWSGAALWFAEAYEQDSKNPVRAATYRDRLANTLRACPRPLHVWSHDADATASYSPDGRRVAVSAGKSVHVWDPDTGTAAFRPLTHEHRVTAFAFSNNGSRLVTVCAGPTVPIDKPRDWYLRVWDSATGEPLTPALRIALMTPGWLAGYGLSTAAVSADAGRVVVSDDARSFAVWDVGQKKLLGPAVPLPHEDWVLTDLRLRPDGRQVATTSASISEFRQGGGLTVPQFAWLGLWDAEGGRAVGDPRPLTANESVAYSDDSRHLRLTGFGILNSIHVCDAATGKALWSRKPGNLGAFPVFSPDGSRVLALPRDVSMTGVRLFDGRTGEPLPGGAEQASCTGLVVFSNDSRLVLIVGDDTARVWNVADLTPAGAAVRHDGQLSSARLSPDGRRMVLVGMDNTARVFDTQSGRALTPLLRHGALTAFATFSPDGSRVLTQGGSTVRLWPVMPPPQGRVLAEGAFNVRAVVRSANGRRLAVARGTENGSSVEKIDLYDLDGGAPVVLAAPEPFVFLSLEFTPDGSALLGKCAGGGDETKVVLWDTAGVRPCAVIRETGLVSAYFTPEGAELLMLRMKDGAEMRRYDARRGEPLTPWTKLPDPKGAETPEFGGVKLIVISPDGRRFFHPTAPALVDARTGATVVTFDPGERGRSFRYDLAAFSPDGRRVLDQDADGTFRVWDAQTGEPVTAVLRLGESEETNVTVSGGRFSPDGTRVLGFGLRADSRTGVARVWDATSGKPVTPLLHHELGMRRAVFSPDGSRVLTAGMDNLVRVWDAETGALLAPPLRHPGSLQFAGFSKDGRRVLTLCYGEQSSVPWLVPMEGRAWDAATGQPLGPPLPLKFVSRPETSLFDPEGRSFARLRPDGVLELADLTADDRPVSEDKTLAQALSGQHIEGSAGLMTLDDGHIRAALNAVKDRSWPRPRSLLEARVWHRSEADSAAEHTPNRGQGLQRKDARAAEWHLDRVLEAAPHDREARRLRAVLCAEAGRWDAALRDWEAVCEQGGAAWYDRGNAHAQLGHWPEAEKDFERAAKDGRPLARSLSALALLRLRRGKEDGWRDACKPLSATGLLDSETLLDDGGFRAVTAAPDAPIDWAVLDKMLGMGLDGQPLAALQYRGGSRDAEALRNLDLDGQRPIQPRGIMNSAAVWFLRALLEHRLKHANEAKDALARGREELNRVETWLADKPQLARDPESWQERVYAEALEREAAKLIEGPKQ
jgi:serine/threonine protein kinase/WD40 repeat protein